MRILICYASAGMGHKKAAEAMYNYLTRHYPWIQIELIDALEFSNPIFKKVYSCGYLYLISRLRFIWGVLYYFSCFTVPLSRPFRFIINRLNTIRFERYILKQNPQVVISTHFLINEVVDYLIRHRKLQTRLFCVITDFGVHPYWIFNSVYRFIVALNETTETLIKAGIDRNKILPIGIPVAEDFYKAYDRDKLRSKFNLKNEEFVVLVVGGAAGVGPIEEIVNQLQDTVRLMVVCGDNSYLLKRLNMKSLKNVRLFGFVDNMHELMSASDVIVTKSGGLSISESIAVGLPMIFIWSLPGQEADNAKLLSKYGVGILAHNIKQIRETVLEFKNNPGRINLVRDSIRRISHPTVLKEIYDEICKGCLRDSS